MSAKLRCPDCGAETDAPCSCGKPFEYIPAGRAAALAVAADPGKSDRAIAAAVGVSHATVSRAREQATVSNETVGTRIGLDGKKRKVNPPRVTPETIRETERRTQLRLTREDEVLDLYDDLTETVRALLRSGRRPENVRAAVEEAIDEYVADAAAA
jgi:hypothetical protein